MCSLRKPIFSLCLLFVFFMAAGCGVKGDPLPPENPPEIGRGRPTYKRASEEIKLQKAPQSHKTPVKDEDDDDDERE
jgi:hypothetical protein